MAESQMQGELLRALRTRNEVQQEQIDLLWKCIDLADVAIGANDEYWVARANLRAHVKRKPVACGPKKESG